MTARILLVAVVVYVLADVCHGSGWWMDQPYGSSSDFNTLVEYTNNATLICEDAHLDDEGIAYQFEYWVRPDLTVMKTGDDHYFNTLDGTAGWRVNSQNQMEVINVQENHFGFYHCIVYSSPDYYVIKKGVNYKGAYFGDLWDIYRLNVIIGCSAAGGFLVACIIIYFIHYAFFDNDSQSIKDKISDHGSVNVEIADDGRRFETFPTAPDEDLNVGYEGLKNDVHLRSSFGKSAGSSGKSNSGYAVDAADELTTQL